MRTMGEFLGLIDLIVCRIPYICMLCVVLLIHLILWLYLRAKVACHIEVKPIGFHATIRSDTRSRPAEKAVETSP